MQRPKNILVHAMVNLGDVVLSTSALALLKQHFPDCRVTMMVKAVAAEIVQNNPVVDDVIIMNYQEKKQSLKSMVKLVRELRRRNFDMSISLDRKLRPALLTWLAGIPIRIGPDRVFDDKPNRVTKLFTHLVHTPDDFLHTHQAEIFQSILRGAFDIHGSAQPVIGQILPEHREKATALLGLLPAGKRIALCLKGTYYLKDWAQEKFARLVEELSHQVQGAFYVVGAPGDYAYAEAMRQQTDIPVMNFCGKTGLLDYAALMEGSDLLVTIDTGGMHIAATTKVPIVGIFRCVSADRWHPLSPRSTVVAGKRMDCPAVKNPEGCPMHYCVGDIPVEDVVKAALPFLKV